MARLTPNRICAIAVAIVGSYLQLVEWVNLFPWNDVRNGNGQETLDLILLAATILLVVFLWFGGRLAAITSTILMAVWAWLQISTWWIPYFQGASPGWKRVYERWFADTVHILHPSENKLPPDANHLVLQLLILVSLAASVWAVFAKNSRHTESNPKSGA